MGHIGDRISIMFCGGFIVLGVTCVSVYSRFRRHTSTTVLACYILTDDLI